MRSILLSHNIFILLLSPHLFLFLNCQNPQVRSDGRCGQDYLSSSGLPGECDSIAPYPTCCQLNGHCGWDCEHLNTFSGSSKTSTSLKSRVTQKVSYTSTGLYRSDGRCGQGFPLEDGITLAECDPNSEYFCCSDNNYCGGSSEHCDCKTCVNYRPLTISNKVRSDRRCGSAFPITGGRPSQCDGKSENYCCSNHGYCGPGDEHCVCLGCVDYRQENATPVPFFTGKVRADRRCGAAYPVYDNVPGECDPLSENPCCSQWGFCGPGFDHCECSTCKDYRNESQKIAQDFVGKVRVDRRCGLQFPIPGSNEPSICDGDSENFCCSKWGYCGFDSEHCDCAECINYKKRN